MKVFLRVLIVICIFTSCKKKDDLLTYLEKDMEKIKSSKTKIMKNFFKEEDNDFSLWFTKDLQGKDVRNGIGLVSDANGENQSYNMH